MRLFVAIELSEAIKKALVGAQRTLGEFDRMVRWVGQNQMHLTLKFLGEVPDHQLPDIQRALDTAASAGEPFGMRTRGAGCFPPQGKARVVWLGLEDPAGGIAACQARVEGELESIGFAAERRPFTAHLTLGRVRDDRSNGQLRLSVDALEAPDIVQEVDTIVLMQSELTPQGARYAKRGVWKLSGGDSTAGG